MKNIILTSAALALLAMGNSAMAHNINITLQADPVFSGIPSPGWSANGSCLVNGVFLQSFRGTGAPMYILQGKSWVSSSYYTTFCSNAYSVTRLTAPNEAFTLSLMTGSTSSPTPYITQVGLSSSQALSKPVILRVINKRSNACSASVTFQQGYASMNFNMNTQKLVLSSNDPGCAN